MACSDETSYTECLKCVVPIVVSAFLLGYVLSRK